ncbi:MAG TPA: LysR family transcriptional regulator, partial [Eoetvoesiella sp.]
MNADTDRLYNLDDAHFTLTVAEAPPGLNRIKLRHLHCLVAIAAHRHMGRAAESLGMSQPAISKTLAELENIVQAALVIRSRRGATLTEKGLTLLGYAGSSLRTLREGLDHISSTVRSDIVEIAIGTLPTVASTVAPRAIRQFKQSWPGARL